MRAYAFVVAASVCQHLLYPLRLPPPALPPSSAFLDYTNIPWTEIEVDPLLKTEIKWSTQYKKVRR